MNLENVLPMDIEKRSFEIITEELGELKLDPDKESITLAIMKNGGFTIVTDTKMAQTGINKAALAKLNGNAVCFMSDPDVAARAKEAGSTRAAACMEKAATLKGPVIIAVGNAPTAFVNVVQSKEIIMSSGVPYIVAVGRKGGSNVAAAICNALMYKLTSEQMNRK